LAYKNGQGQLCRALVTAGANLSICNNDSLSIFTIPAASKALLVNVLGKLSIGSILILLLLFNRYYYT
jgi:hypothetical protein